MNSLQPFALTANISAQSARNETYTVNIFLNIQGDFKTKKYDPLPFHPNMTSTRNAYPTGIIMFVPIIALKKDDVIAEVGLGKDYKSVFTSREKFATMLKHVIKRDKSRYLVTNTDLQNKSNNFKNIENENLTLLTKIFFPLNSLIYILGASYLVRSITYDFNSLIETPKTPKVGATDDVPDLPAKYDITFDITVIRANANGEIPGKTCKEKAVSLNRDSVVLFGKAIFPDVVSSEIAQKTVFVPTLGLTPDQIEWNRRNSRRKGDYLTSANTQETKTMKELDALQTEYDKIDKQWLATTDDVHRRINNITKQIKETKTEIAELKKKKTADLSPYEKRKISSLEDRTNQFILELERTNTQLQTLNTDFAANYLVKFQLKVQPILRLEQELVQLEAELLKLPPLPGNVQAQRTIKDEISQNVDNTTYQLSKLTIEEKKQLKHFRDLLAVNADLLKPLSPSKKQELEDKKKLYTNQITKVDEWENILQKMDETYAKLLKERKEQSASVRIDSETDKEIKKYIQALQIIIAQLQKIEREINPDPTKPLTYAVDIPKAFKDRVELKDNYEKYLRYIVKLKGQSVKYDKDIESIKTQYEKLYPTKGGGQKSVKRRKTRRQHHLKLKLQDYTRQRNRTHTKKQTMRTRNTKKKHCYTRRLNDDAKVDTHLHLRPFGGPSVPYAKVLTYQKKAGILFAQNEGIGQRLPIQNKCTYYKDCPGVRVTPSFKNDMNNAQSQLDSSTEDEKAGVVAHLSMTFPDLAHPQTILPGMLFLEKEYPGLFNWMGEVNLVKQALFPNGHQPVKLNTIKHWKPFMLALRKKRMPLSIHADLGNDAAPYKYLPLMLEVLKLYPKNIIVWMHLGVSKQLIEINPADHVALLDSLLKKYPFLYFDISWRVLYDQIFQDPKKRPYYVELLNKWPRRFLPGTDFIAEQSQSAKNYRKELHVTSNILNYVNNEAFRRIALGQNYLDLLQTQKYQAPNIC